MDLDLILGFLARCRQCRKTSDPSAVAGTVGAKRPVPQCGDGHARRAIGPMRRSGGARCTAPRPSIGRRRSTTCQSFRCMADDATTKDAARWMWSLGDYGAIAAHLEPHAIELAQRSRLQAGSEVLDVAAGNGNFAIAAVRLGATVVATDLTPAMVALGEARSRPRAPDRVAAKPMPSICPLRTSVLTSWRRSSARCSLPTRARRAGAVPGRQARRPRGDGQLRPEGISRTIHRAAGRAGAGAAARDALAVRMGRHRRGAPQIQGPDRHRSRSTRRRSPSSSSRSTPDGSSGSGPTHRSRRSSACSTRSSAASLREDGKKLFTELNQVSGGGLTLESDYLQVLARKA